MSVPVKNIPPDDSYRQGRQRRYHDNDHRRNQSRKNEDILPMVSRHQQSIPNRSRNEKSDGNYLEIDTEGHKPSSSVRLPLIRNSSANSDPGRSNRMSTKPKISGELSEAEDIALKHNLSKRLESVTKESLQSVHRSLQLLDHRNIGVQSTQEIEHQLKRYHVTLSSDMDSKLFSKFVSVKYPGLVDFNRLMGYLMHIKKLPVLDILTLKSDHNKSRLKNVSQNPNKRSYLMQEELPILEELKRQLRDSSLDVSMLQLHANEMDRGFNGVLTKPQVKRLLSKCGVQLTENLLDSMLHYCDHNGYRLYSIEKLMDYFYGAVREDRSILTHNRFPIRRSRVPSPQPPSPLPLLERSESAPPPPMPLQLPQGSIRMDTMEFEEIEPPFDREEWLKRFNFMVRAIYNCHQDQPGFLLVDDVEHITKTYNLVYNLDIPNTVIGQCITQSFNNTNYTVDIRQFVYLLQSLCLQLAKFK